MHRVHTLRLDTVTGQYIVLALLFLFCGKVLFLQLRYLATDIRQYKEVRVFGTSGKRINTFIRQLDRLVLLINDEVQLVRRDVHVLLVLLQVELFGLLQAHFHARLRQVLNQRLRLRHTLERTEQGQLARLTLFLVRRTHLRFRLGQQLRGQGRLRAYQQLDTVLVLVKHLVFALWYRTADNQRRTRIVNQYRVHLIDNREVVTALYQVEWGCRHVVAEVVKTKLVICSKRDIAGISLPTLVRVGLVLVNTIHRQSVEHIQWTHPLRVTLGKVIVHRHHVHTLVRHRVQEHRQRRYQGLTFTRRHLGYLALVKYHAAYQLHVIVHHVPGYLVSTGSPMIEIHGAAALYLYEIKTRVGGKVTVLVVRRNNHFLVLCETTGGRFDDGKHFRQNIVQNGFVVFLDFLLQFIHFVINLLTFVDRQRLNAAFQPADLILLGLYRFRNFCHQGCRTGTQIIVRQRIYLRVQRINLVYIRLYLPHIFLRLVSEQLRNNLQKIHIFS